MGPLTDRAIAVFGSSEPRETESLYRDARQLGGELARAGAVVVTGGYGGVMEAASRGAREAGGTTHGVICDIFSHRSPNAYLDRITGSADLYERTRKLIELSDGFAVLDGKSGTLAELSFLWALERAGCLSGSPVVLFGESWKCLLPVIEHAGMADEAQRRITAMAGSPRQVVELLGRGVTRGGFA